MTPQRYIPAKRYDSDGATQTDNDRRLTELEDRIPKLSTGKSATWNITRVNSGGNGNSQNDQRYLKLTADNDPLTGDLDIIVNSEHALRVVPNNLTATEAWVSANKIAYTTNYAATTPAWTEVAKPSVSNTSPADSNVPNFKVARVTIDGSTLFSAHDSPYGRTAVYKTTTHKTGSPTWTLVIASDAPQVVSGSYITTYIAGIDVIDNYLIVTAQTNAPDLYYVGISADYGATFTWLPRKSAHTPLSYLIADDNETFFYGFRHRNNAGVLIGTQSFKHSIYTSASTRVFRRGGSYDFLVGFSNNKTVSAGEDQIRQISDGELAYYNSDAGTGNGQITAYLYASYGAPASSLPYVYYFDHHGVLKTWDGSAHTRATGQPLGIIRDALYMGGGRLVHARETIVSGSPLVYTSANGGVSFVDASGNLAAIGFTGTIYALDLVFGFTEQDVFNVDSESYATRVYRLISTVAPGIAPLAVASNTLNVDLNADLLDGLHASSLALSSRLINATAPLSGGGDLSADRTLSISKAATASDGYLSSTDWNTFNNKQPAGNYLTALTGDVTATGPGSAAATLATVNSNVGSFGSSTQVGVFTVNAKGLITAASNTMISGVTPAAHDIAGALHTTSGRTSGQVLQATGATTFGWSTKTLTLTGSLTVQVDGTAALGAGTLAVSSTNDVTGATHTHAITSSAAITAAGASLLAVDTNGHLRLFTLSVGTAAAANTSKFLVSESASASSVLNAAAFLRTLTNPTGTSQRAATFSMTGQFTTGAFGGELFGFVANSIIGAANSQAWNGSGGASQAGLVGLYANTQVTSGATGTIGYIHSGLFAGAHEAANTVTNWILAKIQNPTSTGGGAITNLYGLRIEALTRGGTLNRAIDTAGGQLNFLHNADSTLATFTGHSTFAAGTTLVQMTRNDANTNAVGTVLTLAHNSTGTAAASFGLRTNYTLESSTTADQTAGYSDHLWTDATHASRSALYRGTTTGNAVNTGFYGAWAHNAVSSTAITIIPNGTGDVASVGAFVFTVKDNTSATTNGGIVVVNPGGGAISLLSDGTDTLQITCAADGSVTIARSAGTHTFSVSLWGTWQ